MPQLKSKQILGETPVNPNDLTTKEYVDTLFTSGSTLTVQDENNVVLTGVTILNFAGTNIIALADGTNKVSVWVPKPTYAPFFNTSTSTINTNVYTSNRYIASPYSEGNPYKIGNWVAGTAHQTIRSNFNYLSYTSNDFFNVNSLTSTFSIIVYDANNTTIIAQNTIILNGPITYTNQGITINISVGNWLPDSDKYKTKITVSIYLTDNTFHSLQQNGGRFSVKLIHNNETAGIFTYSQNDIFKDIEGLQSRINGTLTIIPGNTINTKYLSGIKVFTNNTQWHVHLDQIQNLNNTSYPTTQQLNITQNGLLISTDLQANGNNNDFVIGTWSNMFNSTNAIYDNPNWITNQLNETNWLNSSGITLDTHAIATIYDWGLTDTKLSQNYNYLIDTYQDIVTRNNEPFNNENNNLYPRLNNNLSSWDNTISLQNINGLQILGSRLIYPQYNFSQYYFGNSSVNYSGLTSDRYYYRKFETNGSSISNGLINFVDYNITELDLTNNNVIFEISIDSGITWFNMNLPYTSGQLINGSGCRDYRLEYGLGSGITDTNSLHFTLGQGGSTYIIMKITFTINAITKYIGNMNFNSGNWD
jgi:hypothetical protein